MDGSQSERLKRFVFVCFIISRVTQCCCLSAWACTVVFGLIDTLSIHVRCDCLNQPSHVALCWFEFLFTSAIVSMMVAWGLMYTVRLWLSGASLIAAVACLCMLLMQIKPSEQGQCSWKPMGLPCLRQTISRVLACN